MRAARMQCYQTLLISEDVTMPAPKADEILLKNTAAGICRADVQCPTNERVFKELVIANVPGYSRARSRSSDGKDRHL
jgi:D-arabinose 1-dehydrogenase-like Zn-dependent alcohol dehydrogenase